MINHSKPNPIQQFTILSFSNRILGIIIKVALAGLATVYNIKFYANTGYTVNLKINKDLSMNKVSVL
jgi:hypothetical protein